MTQSGGKSKNLFAFSCIYAVFLLLETARAFTAAFYGLELAYALAFISPLLFFLLPFAVSYFSPNKIIRNDSEYLIHLLLFFFFGTVFLYFPENIRLFLQEGTNALILLLYLLSGVPFLFFGIACGDIFSTDENTAAKDNVFSFRFCIAASAGVFLFYIFMRFLHLPMGLVTSITASFLIFYASLRLLGGLRGWKKKLALVIAFIFMQLSITWLYTYAPQIRMVYNTLNGSLTIHSVAGEDGKNRMLLQKNYQTLAALPYMNEQNIPHVLIAALQPGKEDISVLLLSSELSLFPRAFLGLPMVEKLVLLSPDSKLLEFATSEQVGILPNEDEGRFEKITSNPRRFIESSDANFDLIFVERPLPYSIAENTYYTLEFITAASKRLAENGAFAMLISVPDGYSESAVDATCGIITATLRKVFKYVESAGKGERRLFIAGNSGNITRDMRQLDFRTKILAGSAFYLPADILSILYPEIIQNEDSERIRNAALAESFNRDIYPELPYSLWRKHPDVTSGFAGKVVSFHSFVNYNFFIVFMVALSLYLMLRYFVSWKPVHKSGFILFENGIFTAGLVTVLFFLYQTRIGTGYMFFSLGLGFFLFAMASAFFLRNRKVIWFLKWVSCFLPALAMLMGVLPAYLCQIFFLFLIFLAGISGGITHRENFSGREKKEKLILVANEGLGCISGLLLFSCFIANPPAFAVCMILISLIRLIRVPWKRGT